MRPNQRLLFLIPVMLLAGCLDFQQTGKDLGSGLTDGIKHNADTVGARLGSGLIEGMRDTLTSQETQRHLAALLDTLGASLARQAAASRDSLLGETSRRWIERLKSDLIGATTREQIGRLRDELLGPKTTGFLRDSLTSVAAGLRNELLGERTREAIDSIITAAITTLSEQYRAQMQPIVHQEEGFVQQHASSLLWMAGGVIVIVLGVAGVIFIRRKNDRDLLGLLTYQIHATPKQDAYDELVARIQRSAQEQGLEPSLREFLRSRGILGRENWRPAAPGGREGR